MDWLPHNLIADMYGPHFLILYGYVITVTLLGCWWGVRSRETSQGARPPPAVVR